MTWFLIGFRVRPLTKEKGMGRDAPLNAQALLHEDDNGPVSTDYLRPFKP